MLLMNVVIVAWNIIVVKRLMPIVLVVVPRLIELSWSSWVILMKLIDCPNCKIKTPMIDLGKNVVECSICHGMWNIGKCTKVNIYKLLPKR